MGQQSSVHDTVKDVKPFVVRLPPRWVEDGSCSHLNSAASYAALLDNVI